MCLKNLIKKFNGSKGKEITDLIYTLLIEVGNNLFVYYQKDYLNSFP